jgi:hypothetical protein
MCTISAFSVAGVAKDRVGASRLPSLDFPQQSQQAIQNSHRMRWAAGDEEVDGDHTGCAVVDFGVVDVRAAG